METEELDELILAQSGAEMREKVRGMEERLRIERNKAGEECTRMQREMEELRERAEFVEQAQRREEQLYRFQQLFRRLPELIEEDHAPPRNQQRI